MGSWNCVLELGADRSLTSGSEAALADAIRRGADLRIYTAFIYNEHIDPTSDNPGIVHEVSDFRETYLIEDRWTAGIMTLRMPIESEKGFGPRASMSFFMYNQDGQQAIARPYLDGKTPADAVGVAPGDDLDSMPKYHKLDHLDMHSNAPCSNFIYDFEHWRFWVRDEWQEVFANTPEGETVSGSVEALTEAFLKGNEIKVGIRGICADLADDSAKAVDHELFIQTGPGYHWTGQGLFSAGTQPVVRVKPEVPMRYTSKGWDFGWLIPRTDGFLARWLCDPHTLSFKKRPFSSTSRNN